MELKIIYIIIDMSMEERVLHILNYTVLRVKSIIKGKSNCQEKKIEGNLRSDEHRHQVKLKKLKALENSSPIKLTEKSTNADYSDSDQVIHNASTKPKYQNNDVRTTIYSIFYKKRSQQ